MSHRHINPDIGLLKAARWNMTMAIDQQQRQFGALNPLNFDNLPPNYSTQFTNPWQSSAAPQQNLYSSSSHNMHQNLGMDMKSEPSRLSNNLPVPSYMSHTSAPPPSSSLPTGYPQQDMMLGRDVMPSRLPIGSTYANGVSYSTAAPSHSTYANSSPFDSQNYASAQPRQSYIPQHQPYPDTRRLSQPSVSSSYVVNPDVNRHYRQRSLVDIDHRGMSADAARDYGDVIDASRGMIAMSQDATPRNIYGPAGGRDSYGFPPTHSSRSSISSTGTYPQYFGGSMDSSVSDYSNTGSDIESVSSRTLPRPSGFLSTSIPPAPASMMGQFSSKVSSSAQKKHKCKVCDKRFTRPSSLQTHMYSHTGEKRKSIHLSDQKSIH